MMLADKSGGLSRCLKVGVGGILRGPDGEKRRYIASTKIFTHSFCANAGTY